MGELYASLLASQSAEIRESVAVALTVDAAAIVETILAIDGAGAAGDRVVGHAALRPFGADRLEVKKVFVARSHRGRGVARLLMSELETIARRRGAASLVLQTGSLQAEAIALYERIGYLAIPPFGLYAAVPNALCYEKAL